MQGSLFEIEEVIDSAVSKSVSASVEDIHLTALTSGGSRAVFFKVNTFGEESFLDTIRDTVAKFEK